MNALKAAPRISLGPRGWPRPVAVCVLAGSLAGCAEFEAPSLPAMPSLPGFSSAKAAPRPNLVQVFIASTRRGETGGEAGKASTDGAHFALASMTLPPSHRPGSIEAPLFGAPNPGSDIAVAGERALDPDEFKAEFAAHISGRIGVNRDVLVFVHGFNTSFGEARLRATQIAADIHFGGVPVLFTWPSKGELFGYVSDKDSATASRDALEELLTGLSATPGVGKIHVLAHSMGGWLAMEALRQAAISGHRDLDGHLGHVMLASPDIDMDVFASQMAKLRPADVTVFASSKDRALSLSSALAQSRVRVGAIDPAKPEDREKLESLGAKVYDLSRFSDGLIDHGAYATAPDVLQSIGAQVAAPRAGEADTMSIIDAKSYGDAPQN